MLFCCNAGQRLEPVGKMRRPLGNRPVLHSFRNRIGYTDIKFFSLINRMAEGSIYISRKSRAHNAVIKNLTSEII